MTLVQFKNKNNGNGNRLPSLPTFFGDFFNDFINDELVGRNVFKSVPAVNISENENGYAVELAAPGMNKDDFKLAVDNNVLSISAEKKEENKEENERYTRKEFSYSSFSRSFTMPEHVNAEGISAEYTNGVLKLMLPKKEEAKKKPVREIKIS
jgi:HSP20 family protein